MRFKLYTDVHEFYKDTYGILMRHEAQNMISLGNIIIGHEGKDKTGWRDPVNYFGCKRDTAYRGNDTTT